LIQLDGGLVRHLIAPKTLTADSSSMGGVSSKEDPKLEPSTSSSQTSEPESSCPVPAEYRNPAIYNVYGQRIDGNQNCPSAANPLAKLQGSDLLDPKNNMPLEPNQQPCPGQRVPLSTERLQSNIPKGGTDATWLYPSPQMFFNGEGSNCLELRMAYGLV
jgi:cytochrome c heme-lyase